MPWVSKGLEPAMQWSWIFAPCLIGTTLSTTQVYHPFAIHLLLHLCTVLKNANSSIYNKHLTSLHSTIQAEVHLTIPQLVRTGGAVRSLPMASLSRKLLKTLHLLIMTRMAMMLILKHKTHKTLPEAQRTQGIIITQIIMTAE